MIPDVASLVAGVAKAFAEQTAAQRTKGAETRSTPVQIPPELLRSIPRDIEWKPAGRAIVVVALAMLAAGVALGVWLAREYQRGAALRQQMSTSASVVSGEITQAKRTRDENPSWIVTYRYSVNGNTYVGRTRFSVRAAPNLHAGDRADVEYVPSHPKSSWLRGYPHESMPLWVPFMVPSGFFLGAGMILFALRRQKRLLEEGRPAIARVTAIDPVRGQHNRGYRASVEFRDISGGTRTGRFQQREKPVAVGAEVVILYDPEERKRLARYPLQFVRVSMPL